MLFRHLLKDIQRKDYKKNKDSTKEGVPSDKPTDKFKDSYKNERQSDISYDLGRLNVKRINEINARLEKKALFLAELREMPTKPADTLRLLDILFDAKKLQKELLFKMEQLSFVVTDIEKLPRNGTPVRLFQTAQKEERARECPTTDPKESRLELGKEDNMGTNHTLFSTFEQV
jgi:hypothetical protein